MMTTSIDHRPVAAPSSERPTGVPADGRPARGTAPAPVRRRPRPRRRQARRLLVSLRTAAAGVLLVALLAALGALVIVPRVAGWVPLTVLTGSMEPTIPTGSQVVIEPVRGEADAARLQVGDIITVMPYPQNPTLVTHRIVERADSSAGVSFVTRGDANGAVDDWEVTATQIRGEVQYWVPGAGYVATALDGQQKAVVIVVVAGGLLLYSAGQVLGGIRAKQRPADG